MAVQVNKAGCNDQVLGVENLGGLGAYGKFAARATFSHLNSYKQAPEPGVGLVEYAGTYEIPRFRAASTLGWERGPWEAVWITRYTGRHGQQLQNTSQDEVSPEVYHVLSVIYSGIKNLRILGGVRNVFDKQPSFSNGGAQNYSYAFGDPRGRGYWMSLTYKF